MKTYTEKEISALHNFSDKYGFTEVSVKKVGAKRILQISHGGNMGNDIKRSVDPNLKQLGFPAIAKLKKMFDCIEEDGSPDYMYTLKLDVTDSKFSDSLISEPGEEKMKDVKKADMKMNELRKIVATELRKIVSEGPNRKPGPNNKYSGDKWRAMLTPAGHELWNILSSQSFDDFYKSEVDDLITGSDDRWDDEQYEFAAHRLNSFATRIKKAVKPSGIGREGM